MAWGAMYIPPMLRVAAHFRKARWQHTTPHHAKHSKHPPR